MLSPALKQIIDRLKELASQESQAVNVISKDWVFVMMVLFRQHLEHTKQYKKYEVLMFYCNWLLHVELDRGIVQDILVKMSKVIDDPTAGHPSDRISEIISLTELRHEIMLVLKSDAGVTAGVFETDSNWVVFSELMFPFILGKPLIKKSSTNTNTEYWVEKLELFDDSGKLGWKIHVNPGAMSFSHHIFRTAKTDAGALSAQ